MDKVKNIIQDIKSGWEELDKKKRIRLIVIVASITILLFILVYFTQRTEYKVLFSDLEEADAGAIVEDLETKNMNYKLEDNGSTILIDKNEVDNYRIELAVNGPMPANSTGFEIFDAANMMATSDDREIMYQRAISGELERAIASLNTIKSAKVLLNIPEASVFENPEYKKEASASVVIEMNNGQMTDSAQIQGIAALVSGAVENLPQSNVEILDTSGNLLSSAYGEAGNLGTDIVTEHQKIRNTMEKDLEQKVLTLLAPIYGLENVQISVHTDLNFDALEQEITEYGEAAIRSQTENVTGSSALARRVQEGLLDPNTVTESEDEADDNDNSTYEHTTNYELNTTTSKIIAAPGAIERMTASVIILNHPEAVGDEETLYRLVENALGINFARNEEMTSDDIHIDFFTTESDEEEGFVIGSDTIFRDFFAWIGKYWWVIVAGIVLIVLIILLVRLLRNRADDELEDYDFEIEEVEPEEIEDSEELVFDKETKEKMRKNEIANEKEDLIRKQTKENPELAAELIKIWLKEDD